MQNGCSSICKVFNSFYEYKGYALILTNSKTKNHRRRRSAVFNHAVETTRIKKIFSNGQKMVKEEKGEKGASNEKKRREGNFVGKELMEWVL